MPLIIVAHTWRTVTVLELDLRSDTDPDAVIF
jgi:hypothetical protein